MANKNIFCNVPWTNTHIYWDGGYGACCFEKSRPYEADDWQKYNVKNMTIDQWHNSEPMKEFRMAIHGSTPLPACKDCYKEEQQKHESKRIKENFKTVIFTELSFDKSYQQSHWYNRFESALHGSDQAQPIDLHIDLGNECNLACKMCHPGASSQIAQKYRTWNIAVSTRKNWTTDDTAWNDFLANVCSISNLNRVHFMGGEPLLGKRFNQFLDYLIAHNKTHVSISFVTNGTIYNAEVFNKLKKFRSADIEVSLESIESNNHYIRQGSSTELVLENIEKLIAEQTDTFSVVLRCVPQLLNINNYHKYILWAFKKKVSIQSIPLITPDYLSVRVLPVSIREQFIKNYQDVIEYIEQHPYNHFTSLSVGRDPAKLDSQLIKECQSMINMLSVGIPDNIDELKTQLSEWLIRWDCEYNLNAFDFYPEYREFLNDIQYRI